MTEPSPIPEPRRPVCHRHTASMASCADCAQVRHWQLEQARAERDAR